MEEIGGYFSLELPILKKEYHENVLSLNNGRNSLALILRNINAKRVYLPYYTCDVVIDTLIKLEQDYKFYNIDSNFIPIFDFELLSETDAFIYVNYFGICEKNVKLISTIQKKNKI